MNELSIEAFSRFFAGTSIPMTLSSADDDMPLVLANDAFLTLTGYGRDEVIGRNCRFLQGSKTDPEARARLRRAIATGAEVLVPITNYRKDGSEFENFVFLVPIFGVGRTVKYYMGSQYDITAPFRSVSLQEQAKILDEGLGAVAGRPAASTLLRFRTDGRGG